MTTSLQKYSIDGFKALVFRMQDILFAADLEQIDELVEIKQWSETGDEAIPLHLLVPMESSPHIYRDPHVISIRYMGNNVSVQIDKPEDIAFIPIEAIRSFPPLINKLRKHTWLWGVGLLQEEPVLLIDCHKMAAACLSEQEAAWN